MNASEKSKIIAKITTDETEDVDKLTIEWPIESKRGPLLEVEEVIMLTETKTLKSHKWIDRLESYAKKLNI